MGNIEGGNTELVPTHNWVPVEFDDLKWWWIPWTKLVIYLRQLRQEVYLWLILWTIPQFKVRDPITWKITEWVFLSDIHLTPKSQLLN